mgnify:CR=1 FL=1|jgi:hypothetical protein
MSYAAERWARAQRVGNARAKQVLVELANCHNGKTGKCTPGIKYLHEVTELKEDTISTATNFLQSKGFIKKTYVAVEKGRAISYELLGFNPQEWERKKTEDSTENGLTQNRGNPESVGPPETGATDSPENGGTGTPEFGGETGNKNRERNREVNSASMRTSGTSAAIAAVASAQAQTPYPEDFDQSLFEEAMLATQDSEQAPEALPDPDADLPPKKQRRSQQPRVPFPETLPDDWAEAAKIARPDIDPQRVFLKLRARYAPTTTKKTLATWKREFMNWIGKEFAYDNRYRSSAQKPQRTLGATDTRSLNHRNFGKWASHAV